MALTKSGAAVDAWAAVALGAVREGAEADVSDAYAAMLHIDAALGATTAHLGLQVMVQVASGDTTDEFWHTVFVAVGLTKTAIKVDLGGDEAAGQTELTVTNPVTANLDLHGKEVFLLDTAAPAESEIVLQTANSGDAGDTITVLDGLTRAQAAADADFYTVDTANISAVEHWNVPIPESVKRVRVLYNNAYGATGSTVYTRARLTKVTAL